MPTKILLIEDNPDHTLLTKRILQRADENYSLDCASDGKEGLNRIFQQDYDVVLCDYRMPGFNALDLLRKIIKMGKDLPLIVITSSGNEKIAVEAMREGAYDYVVKDVSYEDTLPVVIQRTIERYCSKKEKERMEEALRENEERFRSLIQNSSDIIFILDADGIICYISSSVERILGYKPEEMVGKNGFTYFHPEDVVSTQAALANAIQQPGVNVSIVFRALRADGSYAYLEFVANNLLEDPKIKGIVVNARDITERRKAEEELKEAYQKLKETQEELIQSSKMAAMGQLAAGISHELNQPLTGIKGFAQAIMMDLEESNPIREDLKKIEQQAERMEKIIKNIRFFAKKAEFKLEPIDINQPLEDSFMLLNEQLRLHNIRVEKHLNPDLPKIKGDVNQLQQVFLNLITNARDAIDVLNENSGGTITVTTDLDKDRQSIRVVFSDTGCGIKKEELNNIFNPFYTTKSPGGGIGLGLSICYRIIQEHRADIEVDSRIGQGTTFILTFPVIKNRK